MNNENKNFNLNDFNDMDFEFKIENFDIDDNAKNFNEIKKLTNIIYENTSNNYLKSNDGGLFVFQSIIDLDEKIRKYNKNNKKLSTHKVKFSMRFKEDGKQKEYKNFSINLGADPSAFSKDFDYLIKIGQPNKINFTNKRNRMFEWIKEKNLGGSFKNVTGSASQIAKQISKELQECLANLSEISPELHSFVVGFTKTFNLNGNNKQQAAPQQNYKISKPINDGKFLTTQPKAIKIK